MHRINSIQLDIDKNITKTLKKTLKQSKILEGIRQEGSQNEQKHAEYSFKFEHGNVQCSNQGSITHATTNQSI